MEWKEGRKEERYLMEPSEGQDQGLTYAFHIITKCTEIPAPELKIADKTSTLTTS